MVSGGRPAQARRLVYELIHEGASLLVSFGIAGALDPTLDPGTLLIPEAVVDLEGRCVRTDPTARMVFAAKGDLLLLGSDRLVATPAAKSDLARRSGAAAVDMESHVVASAAAAAELPFVVVRAVADRAADRIPQAASRALRPDGTTDVVAVLAALAARPRDLPALVRLARNTRRALATLEGAAPQVERLHSLAVMPRG